MNRGDEAEVANTNVQLVRELVDACTAAGAKPQIIFSSSTHIHRDTPYGASKRACTEIFGAWAERAGAPFYNLVLPGVFGEGGKPFYNSVVSTFCHQLAKEEQPTIQQNAAMRQVHAQEVARWIDAALTARSFGQFEPEGTLITVEELLNRLREFDAKYRQHIIPDVRSPFDLDLFNTYRSYLYPDQYPRQLKLHEDLRGSLFEAVKELNGGQTFLSTTRPGITRGNHFHLRKIERFLVVRGEAEIKIRSVIADEVKVFPVSGERPAYIDIPTLHTHNITNTGNSEIAHALLVSRDIRSRRSGHLR